MVLSQIIAVITFLSFIPLTACSSALSKEDNINRNSVHNNKCIISALEKEDLLKLDYQSFDQSLPDGGWRKYGNQDCFESARDLIDSYIFSNQASLLKWQEAMLNWHSGQMSGMFNDYVGAVSRMEKTFNAKEQATDSFLWNAYVRATINFFKRDKNALVAGRSNLIKGSSPLNHLNVRIIESWPIDVFVSSCSI